MAGAAPGRLDALKVGLVLALLGAGAVVVVIGTGGDEAPPSVPLSADAGSPGEPPAPIVAPAPPPAPERLEKPARPKKDQPPRSEGTASANKSPRGASGVIDVVLTGDATMRRAFAKKLQGVRVVDRSDRGFLLSLKSEWGTSGHEVFSRCAAAISALPQRKLLGSLSSRADVGGEGVDDEELREDATAACAAALADDVSAWLRRHR